MTCRAIWRAKRQDLPLTYDLMASKRLQLDEVVSKVKGVMLFFSSVGEVTTNSMNRKADKKKNPSKEQDSNSQEKEITENHENERAEQPEKPEKCEKDGDIPYPAISYFIVCRKGFKDAASNIHKVLYEAETEVEIKELKTRKQNQGQEKDVLSKLCQVLKDLNSSYAECLLKYSVEFCYNQAVRYNLEESSDEEKRKLFPFLSSSADDTSLKNLNVPTRLCVIDMEEYGVETVAAIRNLKRDGLHCVFQDNSKL